MREIFAFDALFIHQKLILQLLDSFHKMRLASVLQQAEYHSGNLKQIFINDSFTEAILRYLTKQKIKSLEEKLFLNEELKKGELIWYNNDFYFKGITKAEKNFKKGKLPAYAEFHITLKQYDDKLIYGKFNFEHVHWSSASNRLSGHKTKFMLAYIDDVQSDKITLRPIFIADRILKDDIVYEYDSYSLRLDVSDIDEFKKIESISTTDKELNIKLNKLVPEEKIKQSIAEIINENNVPKDWGGENSDLFTNHIHIKGERYSAAFLLKGPAKFHPMTVKDLGANGNQIVRLFDEPADILILQHCHYIKAEIYKTMDAFASRFDNIRRYCIIDGIDTQRLLTHIADLHLYLSDIKKCYF
jgi:hypothetical protein